VRAAECCLQLSVVVVVVADVVDVVAVVPAHATLKWRLRYVECARPERLVSVPRFEDATCLRTANKDNNYSSSMSVIESRLPA